MPPKKKRKTSTRVPWLKKSLGLDDTKPELPERPKFIDESTWLAFLEVYAKNKEETMRIAMRIWTPEQIVELHKKIEDFFGINDKRSWKQVIDDGITDLQKKADKKSFDNYKKMRKYFESAPKGSKKKRIADARDVLSAFYQMGGRGTDEDFDRAIHAAMGAGVAWSAKELGKYIIKKYPGLIVPRDRAVNAISRGLEIAKNPRQTYRNYQRRIYEGLPEEGETVEVADVGSFPLTEEEEAEMNRPWQVDVSEGEDDDVFEEADEIPEDFEEPTDITEMRGKYGIPDEEGVSTENTGIREIPEGIEEPEPDLEFEDELARYRRYAEDHYDDNPIDPDLEREGLIDERLDPEYADLFEEPPPLEPAADYVPEADLDDVMLQEPELNAQEMVDLANEHIAAAGESVEVGDIGQEVLSAEELGAAGPAGMAAVAAGGGALVALNAYNAHVKRKALLKQLQGKRNTYRVVSHNIAKNLNVDLVRGEESTLSDQGYYGPSGLSYLKFREKHPEIREPPVNEVMEKIGKLWRSTMSIGEMDLRDDLDYQWKHVNQNLASGYYDVYGNSVDSPYGHYNYEGSSWEIEDYMNNYNVLSKWKAHTGMKAYQDGMKEIMSGHKTEISYSANPNPDIFGQHPLEDSFAKATPQEKLDNARHATGDQIQLAIDRATSYHQAYLTYKRDHDKSNKMNDMYNHVQKYATDSNDIGSMPTKRKKAPQLPRAVRGPAPPLDTTARDKLNSKIEGLKPSPPQSEPGRRDPRYDAPFEDSTYFKTKVRHPHANVFVDDEHPLVHEDLNLNQQPHPLDGKDSKWIHGSGAHEVDRNFSGFGYKDPKQRSLAVHPGKMAHHMSHDKNGEKMKAHSHDASQSLQMMNPRHPGKGLKSGSNTEVHNTTPSGHVGHAATTYHPNDATHPLGGYHHEEHSNAVGADHQPTNMVEPGNTYDPMEAAGHANTGGGPLSRMRVGDLRSMESFLRSTVNHEPLAKVAHTNFMHYLGESNLFL